MCVFVRFASQRVYIFLEKHALLAILYHHTSSSRYLRPVTSTPDVHTYRWQTSRKKKQPRFCWFGGNKACTPISSYPRILVCQAQIIWVEKKSVKKNLSQLFFPEFKQLFAKRNLGNALEIFGAIARMPEAHFLFISGIFDLARLTPYFRYKLIHSTKRLSTSV